MLGSNLAADQELQFLCCPGSLLEPGVHKGVPPCPAVPVASFTDSVGYRRPELCPPGLVLYETIHPDKVIIVVNRRVRSALL